MKPLLIALPKGRLEDELLPRLKGSRFELDPRALKSRKLRIPMADPALAAILLKGADLPRYVAGGVAALGVVGSDILDETAVDLMELADLNFGVCRLSLCAPERTTLEQLRRKPHLRLATKFLGATGRWLSQEGITAELVPLQSSVELAPVLGLADGIVDLVQSGRTLQAHHLVELVTLGKASARLVACRGTYLSEPDLIGPLARDLAALLKAEIKA
ncbi:MAG: ATP phosphoribosyltransferase [Holophaga sp.]|nr:ATP phosphoribosyltransferase [Holophaga sp.]